MKLSAASRYATGFWADGIIRSGEVHDLNYRPNGCVHSVTTQHGATLLAVVWGRIELV